MKKIIKLLKIIIILVISVFLILFIIGIFSRDNSKKKQDVIYKYEPEETKEYVPLDILNPMGTKVDEESIPDEEYSDTLEQAMENSNIDIPPEDDYMRNIDKIIKEFRSEEYVTICFISEKGETEASITFAKFKIKEIEGKQKYVFLTKVCDTVAKDTTYVSKISKGIKLQLTLSDALQDLNVNPKNTRFVYGVVPNDTIYSLKIEGQQPDEIIHFELLGHEFYLWYYLNLISNHSGDTLSYEIKE